MSEMTIEQPSSKERASRQRIPVAILGATGSVGQRFIQLLAAHPWFRIHEVVASDRSAGKAYGDAADWKLETSLPTEAADLRVRSLGDDLESALVFSSLDASVAGEAEELYASRGCAVVSNSRNHRMAPDVPLLIPEVNCDHLDALKVQKKRRGGKGFIVTNPNCSTIGLAMAVAPIERAHGIDVMHAFTMQAVSGAGYAGVSSFAILDNVVPYIGGEEEKVESEPRKILGRWTPEGFKDAPMKISAHTNRVPVLDGHTICVSLRFRQSEDLRRHFPIEKLIDDVREALVAFRGEPQRLGLPSAPEQPIVLLPDSDRPQPRLDRNAQNGMAVTVGRLRPCPVLDIRLVALVHNTIRGAAGAAILNAELLHARKLLP
ncbi:MAG TPA: aspartate-semialdehyde dehydrogenase [Thermoanaerobaculia bacterium]|nr:aspartate-semialdehyde dehydrogenase [Thermoanaerobaculia bacterium]